MGFTAVRSGAQGKRPLLPGLSGHPQIAGLLLSLTLSGRKSRPVLIADLLDLVLPGGCSGCAAPGAALCERCSVPLARPAVEVAPVPSPAGFPSCHAVAAYDGAVRSALIAYKERGRRELCRPLGAALAGSVLAAAAGGGPVLLVPVPSRRRAVRERGADTTKALALEASRALRRSGVEALTAPALRLCRPTSDSAGLSAVDRAVNVSGAMAARVRDLAGRRDPILVIVDDLITTGATLAEAARALAAVDRPAIAAAVVAATMRRGVGFAASGR